MLGRGRLIDYLYTHQQILQTSCTSAGQETTIPSAACNTHRAWRARLAYHFKIWTAQRIGGAKARRERQFATPQAVRESLL
jgi:hypothetical protein